MLKKIMQIGPITLAFTLVAGFLFTTSTFAMPVRPDKTFIDLDGTQPVTGQIEVVGKADQDGTKTVSLSVLGMEVDQENGQDRNFFTPNAASDLASNIALEQSEVEVAPGQSVSVKWTLTPTADLRCGTNLAAIVVTENPEDIVDDDESFVTFQTDIVSQIHVNVQSQGDQICSNEVKLNLVDFGIDGSANLNHPDVSFVTRLENTGTLIAREELVAGNINVTGFATDENIKFNASGLDVYPGTTRVFNEEAWVDADYPEDGNLLSEFFYELSNLKIGRYQAELLLEDAQPESLSDTVSFWIIPWKIVFVLLLVLAVIVGLAVLLLRAMKQNKDLEKKVTK